MMQAVTAHESSWGTYRFLGIPCLGSYDMVTSLPQGLTPPGKLMYLCHDGLDTKPFAYLSRTAKPENCWGTLAVPAGIEFVVPNDVLPPSALAIPHDINGAGEFYRLWGWWTWN